MKNINIFFIMLLLLFFLKNNSIDENLKENLEISEFDKNVYDLKKSVYCDFLRLIDINKITDPLHINWLKDTVYFSLDQYKEIYSENVIKNIKDKFEFDYKKIIDFKFLIYESRVVESLKNTISKYCITEYGKDYLENDDLFQFIENSKDYKIHFNNLIEKQKIIKEYIENDQKFNELEEFLKNFKKIENFGKKLYKEKYEQTPKTIFEKLRLEFLKFKKLKNRICKLKSKPFIELLKSFFLIKHFTGFILGSFLIKKKFKNINIGIISIMLNIPYIFFLTFSKALKYEANEIKKINFFEKYFKKNFELKKYLFESYKFFELFDEKLKIKINELLFFPEELNFKSNLIDKFVGMNIKKTNEFLHLLKIRDIGELDSLYAKATFLREQKKLGNNDFNFPEYLTTEKGPFIKAENIFSPEYENSVKNSLNLCKNTNRNILIVGPSGSGKTDILRLCLKCILMGNLGIVPGNLSYTPFQSIGQNIKNIQNINLSKGEQERADNVKIVKNSMESKNLSFNIFDEIYSAVDDKTSKILCQTEIVPLLKNENSINLINTHFSSNLFLVDTKYSTKGYFMGFDLIKNDKEEIIDYKKQFKIIEKNLKNEDKDFWLSCDEKIKEKIISLIIEKEKMINV